MANTEKQYEKMLTTPIPKLIVGMSIPTVISMLVTVIYNTADTYFVSQINKSASAAVGAVYSIMAIIQAVGYGLAMGSGSLVSRKLGEKENDKANMYASSAFFVSFLAGFTVLVFGLIFLRPMLFVLGCSKTMMPYAVPYAKYILIAAPLNCATFVLNSTLRSGGQVAFAMWGMGIGGLVNIILDPIFIFKLGLGTGGAAIATALSQIISFFLLILVFLSKRSIVNIKFSSISFKKKDYLQIITTGLPTIFRQSMGCLASALLNIRAVTYGDAAVSAVTIANKVYVLIRNIVLGIGQGFQPVAGYNYGAKNKKRTWRSFTFTGLLGSIICIVSTVLVAYFAGPIMQWFSKDAEVVQIGIETLYFVCAVMPLMAVSTYVNQLYQCLGFKTAATVLASLRQGILFVPAIIILPFIFGRAGVQMAQPVADLLTFVVSLPFIVVFYRKYIKENG